MIRSTDVCLRRRSCRHSIKTFDVFDERLLLFDVQHVDGLNKVDVRRPERRRKSVLEKLVDVRKFRILLTVGRRRRRRRKFVGERKVNIQSTNVTAGDHIVAAAAAVDIVVVASVGNVVLLILNLNVVGQRLRLLL